MPRTPMARWLPPVLAAFLLGGCGRDDVAGNGGGIEIPNGMVVRVVDSGGRALPGAVVRTYGASSWVGAQVAAGRVLVDSSRTDARGNATVKRAPWGETWVEALDDSSGARLRTSDSSSRLVLGALGELSGTLVVADPGNWTVWLAGTGRSTRPGADGRFVFERLPSSQYQLVALHRLNGISSWHAAGEVRVEPGMTDRVQARIDRASLALDDFEDGDAVGLLHGILGFHYWWMNANVPLDQLSKVFGISEENDLVRSEGTAHFLSVTVDVTNTGAAPWANIGLAMGQSDTGLLAVSGLQGLRLRLRGAGTWVAMLNTSDAGKIQTWRARLPLDSTWNEVVLKPELFVQPSGATGATWGGSSWRLESVVFQIEENGWLQIDDLKLDGLSLGDVRD